jgi:two-component system phosphate regulon response regulator OmpR
MATTSQNREPGQELLLVEDDERLAPLVQRHLTESGFRVEWVTNAVDADAALRRRPLDLAILDLMLPGEDGLTLCRRLRKTHDLGIIMVTARGEEADRIVGLDLGADDYLTKPFSLWELEARIKAVLRRYAKGAKPRRTVVGPFVIDHDQRTMTMDGERLDLTRSEFDIIALLSTQPGVVFSRERLLETLQGGESAAFDRAVDTHISNVRRKLAAAAAGSDYIKTVWGVGYRLEVK